MKGQANYSRATIKQSYLEYLVVATEIELNGSQINPLDLLDVRIPRLFSSSLLFLHFQQPMPMRSLKASSNNTAYDATVPKRRRVTSVLTSYLAISRSALTHSIGQEALLEHHKWLAVGPFKRLANRTLRQHSVVVGFRSPLKRT